MASTYLNILVDDDTGTPTAPNYDGTPLDSVFFAELEAILNEFITRPTKIVGGTWNWETAGTHAFSGAATPGNRLLVRNTEGGSGNYAAFTLGNNLFSVIADFAVFASNAAVSSYVAPNRTVLAGYGDNGVATVATHVNGELFWYSNNARYMMNMRFTSGIDQLRFSPRANPIGAHLIIGSDPTTTTAAVFQNGHPGVSGDVVHIGCNYGAVNSGASGRYNTSVGGGYFNLWHSGLLIYAHINSAGTITQLFQANLIGGSASLMLGSGSPGSPGNVQLVSGSGSPNSGQLLFGGDGSGWQLAIGRNSGGSIAHFWKFVDNGTFLPVNHQSQDIGSPSTRVGTLYSTNGDYTGGINVLGGISVGAINPLTNGGGALGSVSLKWGALHVVDANFGDISFDNGWSITEGEKVGLGPGLAFVDQHNDLKMFVGEHGDLYCNRIYSGGVEDLRKHYVRMTKEERLRGR